MQHWWHPPSGRGVRTRISDDRIWLPYALLRYLDVTRDAAILSEQVPFLDGPLLAPEQEDAYFAPSLAAEGGTLYEHAARALDVSLEVGSHGLPLMGTGDWNDGMNRVGVDGAGESVWLAWLLISTLGRFARLAEGRDELERAARYRRASDDLRAAVSVKHGMASGTAARISTTARPWDRAPTPNVVSTRSRNRGRYCRKVRPKSTASRR